MKTLLSITAFLLLLLSTSFVSAQTLSKSEVETLREERAVYLFQQQNKFDISKEKSMAESGNLVAEKADLQTKRREIQVINDPSFPKMVETNDMQKGSWEYGRAKQAWIEANPEKYATLMQRTNQTQ